MNALYLILHQPQTGAVQQAPTHHTNKQTSLPAELWLPAGLPGEPSPFLGHPSFSPCCKLVGLHLHPCTGAPDKPRVMSHKANAALAGHSRRVRGCSLTPVLVPQAPELCLPGSFLSTPPGMGEQQEHRATRIRATHPALSVIITIMIYKNKYFSGNCVKLLLRSGEGGEALVMVKTFLEGGENMPTSLGLSPD